MENENFLACLPRTFFGYTIDQPFSTNQSTSFGLLRLLSREDRKILRLVSSQIRNLIDENVSWIHIPMNSPRDLELLAKGASDHRWSIKTLQLVSSSPSPFRLGYEGTSHLITILKHCSHSLVELSIIDIKIGANEYSLMKKHHQSTTPLAPLLRSFAISYDCLLSKNGNRSTAPFFSFLNELWSTSLRTLVINADALNRGYTAIPPTLGQLHNLHTLKLHNFYLISHLPSTMASLTSLQHLDLSISRVVDMLPSFITRLTSLQTLIIESFYKDSESRNAVNLPFRHPEWLAHLPRLVRLEICSYEMATIPDQFCPNLLQLTLFDNDLLALPLRPVYFSSLTCLHLIENPIETIPDSFWLCMPNLQELNIQSCEQLVSMSDSDDIFIKDMHSLVVLSLTQCYSLLELPLFPISKLRVVHINEIGDEYTYANYFVRLKQMVLKNIEDSLGPMHEKFTLLDDSTLRLKEDIMTRQVGSLMQRSGLGNALRDAVDYAYHHSAYKESEPLRELSIEMDALFISSQFVSMRPWFEQIKDVLDSHQNSS